jgi:exonuclease III
MSELHRPLELGRELDRLNGNVKKRRLPSARRLGAMAVVSLALVVSTKEGINIYDRFNTSGVVEQYGAYHPKNDQVDNRVRLVTWNVANRTLSLAKTIKRLAKKNDAVLLQEVQESDIELLKEELPESMSVIYGFADGKEHGGYGDAIVTEEPYNNAHSVSIKGSSTVDYGAATVAGVGKGIVDGLQGDGFSLGSARANEIENREVLIVDLEDRINGQTKKIRIINSHIGAGDARRPYKTLSHRNQFKELLEIVKEESKDKNVPTFVCLDANEESKNVIAAFNSLGFTFREPVGPTSNNHPIAIDFCGARGAGYGEEKILHNKGSDHKDVRYTWDMDDESVTFPSSTPIPAAGE